MRKSILVLLTFVFMFSFSEQLLGQSHEVKIKIISGKSTPFEAKSVTNPVDYAYVNYVSNCLCIGFGESLGKTQISITESAGTLVYTTTCDVAAGRGVFISIPSVSGQYTIVIIAKEYEGYGFFEVK